MFRLYTHPKEKKWYTNLKMVLFFHSLSDKIELIKPNRKICQDDMEFSHPFIFTSGSFFIYQSLSDIHIRNC